jgi:NitT/TauT family transport system permease protein
MSARHDVLPVLAVVAGIVVLWYAGAVWLNAAWAFDQAGRGGKRLRPTFRRSDQYC